MSEGEISKGSEKSLARRGVNESDEREEWTLKICVSVCMSASSKQTHYYLSQENKNCQARPQAMITRPVLYVRQLMLLPSLAHGHTTTRFFKGLKAGLFTQSKIGSLNLPQFKHKFT